jgi:cytochrome d ubiquinol oxidase subunit I
MRTLIARAKSAAQGGGRCAVNGTMVLASDIPARAQMASSLGFHIVFACMGISFPTIIMVAEWIGIKRNDPAALLLAHRWAKVMAVLIAVGAVSGTVLSYEMGVLWPGMEGRFGAAIGIPFSVEAMFFFLEAVFSGVYLYGFRRLSPWAHWWTAMPIAVSGLLGAMSVVAANSWMNQPGGFTLKNGHITGIDPFAVYFNKAMPYEVPHMILAAYMVAGFLTAGVYAVGLLRGRNDHYHRLGFAVSFAVAGIATPIQLVMGDTITRAIEYQQPLKFAAMEYVQTTHRGVTEWLGGVLYHGHVYAGLGIPDLDSILFDFNPNSKIIGLDSAPPPLRPELPSLIHLSFDTMVAMGSGLLLLAAVQAWHWWFRRRLILSPWFLVPAALSGAASVLALECGWIVTEVGRQPWIVYGILKVSDAVTVAKGVDVTLGVSLAIYGVLSFATIGILRLMSRRWRTEDAAAEEREGSPYGPTSPVRRSTRS